MSKSLQIWRLSAESTNGSKSGRLYLGITMVYDFPFHDCYSGNITISKKHGKI
jgi:hypothetical protein